MSVAIGATLILSRGDDERSGVIEDDAFGNVAGGKLWGELQVALWAFPEGAFRLMLKQGYDLGLSGIKLMSVN